MNPLINDSILQVLQQELEAAKQRHQEARDQFWKVTGQLHSTPGAPATVPQPDVVGIAIAEETAARRAHLDALIRINDYLIRGKIPEHLPEHLKEKRQQASF